MADVQTVTLFMTDFGQVQVSPSVAALYMAARRRKDGSPDRRTRHGRRLDALMSEATDKARTEYERGTNG